MRSDRKVKILSSYLRNSTNVCDYFGPNILEPMYLIYFNKNNGIYYSNNNGMYYTSDVK